MNGYGVVKYVGPYMQYGLSGLLYAHVLVVTLYQFRRRILSSAGKDLKGSVFLEALAAREEANRNGKMTVSL